MWRLMFICIDLICLSLICAAFVKFLKMYYVMHCHKYSASRLILFDRLCSLDLGDSWMLVWKKYPYLYD